MSKTAFFFEDIPKFEINRDFANHQIKQLIKNENKEPGDISIIFCSDDYLYDMNKTYLNHDYYTDIITFNYVEGNLISGDLFISTDRIRENAFKFDVTFYEELYRVILHGVLHLVGYNDETKLEKTEMREKENFYLAKIKF